jgi:hypothetical protein
MACDQVSAQGMAANGTEGNPALPAASSLIAVPPDSAPALVVDEIQYEVLPGAYRVCPTPTLVVESDLQGNPQQQIEQYEMSGAGYQASGYAPALQASIDDQGSIRNQAVVKLAVFPVQYDPASGSLRLAKQIHLHLSLHGASLHVQTNGSNMASSPDDEMLKSTLLNYADSLRWRSSRLLSPTVASSLTAAGPVYKLTIPADGIYEVSYADLVAAGVPVAEIDPHNLHLMSGMTELAIWMKDNGDSHFDPGESFVIYGQAANFYFTTSNVYLLKWDSTPGLRMVTEVPGPVTTPVAVANFPQKTHYEQNNTYLINVPSGPNKDHWYWIYVGGSKSATPVVPPPAPITKEFYIAVTNPDTGAASLATLTGFFKGFAANPIHHVLVSVNGVQVTEITWSPAADELFSAQFPANLLLAGANTIRLTLPQYDGTTLDQFYVNWFDLEFPQKLVAVGDRLDFSSQAGAHEYRVTGFSGSGVELYDVTDPHNPKPVSGATVAPENGSYTLALDFNDSVAHRFVAQLPSNHLKAASIALLSGDDLRSTLNGADYLIITHPSLLAAAQPLADYRAGQGLRTKVVSIQAIYDQFANGLPDPQAIHDFLAYAYQNWQAPAPLYVLLLGDGNFDFLNNYGRNESEYVPPIMGNDPWIGDAPSDNLYVLVSGNDHLPDMYIGRLPVKTAAEVQVVTNKIIAYESAGPAAWNTQALFVADKTDQTLVFSASADNLAAQVPADFTINRVYYGKATYPLASDARAAIQQNINAGIGLVTYFGHAASSFWSNDKLLAHDDVAGLTNGGKLPFFISLACMDGYFTVPSGASTIDYSSLAETLVRAPDGGSIASFSPGGYGTEEGHAVLSSGLVKGIFTYGMQTAGAATTYAKYYLASNSVGYASLLDTYNLIGDPALRLKFAPSTSVAQLDLDVSLSLLTSGEIKSGQWIDLALAYANISSAPAGGVTLSLDPVTALINPQVTVPSGWETNMGAPYTWSRLQMAPGETGRITIHAQVMPGFVGSINLAGQIFSDQAENDLENNNASLSIRVDFYQFYLPLVTRFK